MLDHVAVAAALATLLVFGYALLAGIARFTPLYSFERFGIAFVLGTGVTSLLWILFAPIYGFVAPKWVLTAIAWSAAIITFRRRARLISQGERETAAPPTRLTKWMTRLGWVVLTVQIAALISTAAHIGLGFDALFNFEIKARLAFENHPRGRIPLEYFQDESRAWSHPRYPLLVPFVEFWIYEWIGRPDSAAAKIIFPLYYVALVCITGGCVRRLTGPGVALAAVVMMGTLPSVVVLPGAISGYAEVPLAAAIAAAVTVTLIALRTKRPRILWLAGVLAAVASWTKVEGAVLALTLAALGVLIVRRQAVRIVVPVLVLIVVWGVFLHVYGIREQDFLSLSPTVALAHISRLPLIARLAGRELITPGHWGLLWPVFLVACADAAWQRRWTVEGTVLAGMVLVPLFAYPTVYLFSSWPDVEGHLKTSFARLLVPLAPLAIIFLAARLFQRRELPVP